MALFLDGKKLSHNIEKKLRDFQTEQAPFIKPKLAILQVEGDPASLIYIKHKEKKIQSLGWLSHKVFLPRSVLKKELEEHIDVLNEDSSIHGIILQLPLPPHLGQHQEEFLTRISPLKDVDGLHPLNQGQLLKKTSIIDPLDLEQKQDKSFVPSTPLGCLMLLKHYAIPLEGKKILMVGRSSLVGKPLGLLLLREGGTVTFAHSKTENLKSYVENSHIVCVAIGCSERIDGAWLAEEATLIDIGIHQKAKASLQEKNDNLEQKSRQSFIWGDVHLDGASKNRLKAYTPVPGGVGPMTVISLMYNVLKAWCFSQKCPPPTIKYLLS